MIPTGSRKTAVGVLALALAAACAGTRAPPVGGGVRPQGGGPAHLTPAEQARADSGRPHYTDADVEFMSGMIAHHSQAIVMAGWAESHGASASVRALCERIVVAQTDEIASMSRWLRDRRLPVPPPDPRGHVMPGIDHPMLMPGMLTPEQMAELDRARGAEFDRLFLVDMIQHHRGAVAMVEQLMGSAGAAQDDAVFKFASDVNADQTTEIDRMTTMLEALPTRNDKP